MITALTPDKTEVDLRKVDEAFTISRSVRLKLGRYRMRVPTQSARCPDSVTYKNKVDILRHNGLRKSSRRVTDNVVNIIETLMRINLMSYHSSDADRLIATLPNRIATGLESSRYYIEK